jgi:mycoredoxin
VTATITMYSTVWCGHCRRLKRELEAAGIDYVEVDIDQNSGHDDAIMAAAGGYRTVPTVAVGGRLLVNPSASDVKRALGSPE